MNFSVTSITYFIGFTMKKWFLQIVCGLEVENFEFAFKIILFNKYVVKSEIEQKQILKNGLKRGLNQTNG